MLIIECYYHIVFILLWKPATMSDCQSHGFQVHHGDRWPALLKELIQS